MNVNDVYQSNYLAASDVGSRTPTVTITQVDLAKLPDGSAKLCVFFNNKPKGMLLNKTNARLLSSLYGDESEGWLGKEVKVIVVWTEFQGKPVKALRLMPPDKKAEAAASTTPRPAPAASKPLLDDEIPF